MVKRKCRDCGERSEEHPADPAPRLCSACYGQRMERLKPLAINMIDTFGWDIAMMWLEDAFVDIGGETPEAAQRHVAGLRRGRSISYEEWLGTDNG